MNKEIRQRTVDRSGGSCEACGKWAGESGHFDHFWSRRNGESLESGWIICALCDYEKTHNHPSAYFWVSRFLAHVKARGYAEQVARCETRLAVLEAKGLGPKAMRA